MENSTINGRRVVLCGDSIFMLAIEAVITAEVARPAEITGNTITRLPKRPSSLARLLALSPDIIIFEQDEDSNIFFRMLAQTNVSLIEVNPAQQTIQVFDTKQAPLNDIQNVLHTLQTTEHPKEMQS